MKTYVLLLLIPILLMGYDSCQITVGPRDADYTQIQYAIDNSSRGDVVEVHSGLYEENVHIYKTLTLLGVDSCNGTPWLMPEYREASSA